jgi:CRISPR type III-B/RAMP module RAMP protein Cmr6
MTKLLKGDPFLNRYRFTGTLTTCSPLHIGTGAALDPEVAKKHKKGDAEKLPEISAVIKDYRGKPLIPGSALRGVMRHWLFSILLAGFGDEWAFLRKYQDASLASLSQKEQIEAVRQDFSWLELLFGTPYHEGKIEVWDACCKTGSIPSNDSLLGWNKDALTYIDTSVAINPATGTALEDLLYNVEVVPPGVEFAFNLAGQNLADEEIGLVMLALQGFNSRIYPIRVGARTGRGYGRLAFSAGPVYGLKKENLKQWVAHTMNSFGTAAGTEAGEGEKDTGYFALPKLSEAEQQRLIAAAKAALKPRTEG